MSETDSLALCRCETNVFFLWPWIFVKLVAHLGLGSAGENPGVKLNLQSRKVYFFLNDKCDPPSQRSGFESRSSLNFVSGCFLTTLLQLITFIIHKLHPQSIHMIYFKYPHSYLSPSSLMLRTHNGLLSSWRD